MLFTDRLTLGKPRKTADGYMAVRAKAARSGVYEYLGREIDPDGTTFTADQVVRVYRPEDEVFNTDSVASFLMKPVTNEHPTTAVNAANWRDHAKGVIGKALRDGEFLAFDIVIMDAKTIEAVEDGKRELSNGYASEISFEDGTSPEGTRYQAVQRHIRGNHVAVVDKGRAGSDCRIGDAATCGPIPGGELEKLITDERTYSGETGDGKNSLAQVGGSQVATKTITFDGLPVEVTDAAEAVIQKLQGQLSDANTAKAAAETKVGELTATVSTKDGEIAALNTKLKDAEIGPEKLEKMVADRSALIDQAKAIDPNVVTDGKSEAEIRKAVVATKLGDAAKDLDDAAVNGAFAVLSKDAKPADTLRTALKDGVATPPSNQAASMQSARAQWLNDKSTAYRGQPAN